MSELCDLRLTVYKERDPEGDGERIRIRLTDELQMLQLEECYPITGITEKTARSGRYFVREAVTLVLRRVVSEAFRQGMISDSLGSWTISKPTTKESSSIGSEIELEL